MSDDHRRLLCRLVFFVLCLAPTLSSLYWICHPQTAEGWSTRLQAELGVEAIVHDLETPGPNITILRDVSFLAGDQPLLETVEAEVHFGSDLNRVIIPYAVKGLDNLRLIQLARVMHDHMVRTRSAKKDWRIEFCKDVVVPRAESLPAPISIGISPTPAQRQLTLSNLEIRIEPSVTQTTSRFYFRVRSRSGEISDELALVVSSGKEQLVRLDTNGAELPMWLLEGMGGLQEQIASKIGSESTFRGRLTMRPRESHLESLVGTFQHVDVTGFNGNDIGFGYEARIDVTACEFQDGKFINWLASLESPQLPRTPIPERKLLVESRKFDLKTAIFESARESRARISRREEGFQR